MRSRNALTAALFFLVISDVLLSEEAHIDHASDVMMSNVQSGVLSLINFLRGSHATLCPSFIEVICQLCTDKNRLDKTLLKPSKKPCSEVDRNAYQLRSS